MQCVGFVSPHVQSMLLEGDSLNLGVFNAFAGENSSPQLSVRKSLPEIGSLTG